MKALCSFKTIEDFWRYFNHIPKPSEVFYDGDTRKIVGPKKKTVEEYSLFKKGIEPEWGDPRNATGGEWFLRKNLESDVLNMYWQNLVMGCIGEVIEDRTDITEDKSGPVVVNGARVVDKGKGVPMFRLELWINTKDPVIKERVRGVMADVMTDGLPQLKRGPPKFDWRDHS